MKAQLTTLAALLVVGGSSLAIGLAPTAIALPKCAETEQGGGREGGSNTVCESPGDAEIDARPGMLAKGAMGGLHGFFG